MMTPRSPSSLGGLCAISAAARRSTLKVPVRLTAITRANSSSGIGPCLVTVRMAAPTPAHLTHTCTGPERSTACSTAACTSSALVTSAGVKRAGAPSRRATSSPADPGRSRMTALPPFSTIISTVAPPRPDAPPVTSATAPASFMGRLHSQIGSPTPGEACAGAPRREDSGADAPRSPRPPAPHARPLRRPRGTRRRKARRARRRPRPPQARLRPGGRRPPGRGRHPRHAPRRHDRSRERDARGARRRAAERGLRSLGGHRRRELPGSDRSHRRAGGDAARRRLGAAARRRDRRPARLLAPAHPRPPARLERGVGTRARARPPRRGAGAARRAARLPARRRDRRARERGGGSAAHRADLGLPLHRRGRPRTPDGPVRGATRGAARRRGRVPGPHRRPPRGGRAPPGRRRPGGRGVARARRGRRVAGRAPARRRHHRRAARPPGRGTRRPPPPRHPPHAGARARAVRGGDVGGMAARLPRQPVRGRHGGPHRLLLHVAAGRRARPGARGRRQPNALATLTSGRGGPRARFGRAPPPSVPARAAQSIRLAGSRTRARSPGARTQGLPEQNDPDLISPVARRETTQHDPGVITETRPKEKLKRPLLYKVLFHNDDYTTMEFVVWALMSVFHHDETTATGIMLHVHKNGIGVAGVYPRDIAEPRT